MGPSEGQGPESEIKWASRKHLAAVPFLRNLKTGAISPVDRAVAGVTHALLETWFGYSLEDDNRLIEEHSYRAV